MKLTLFSHLSLGSLLLASACTVGSGEPYEEEQANDGASITLARGLTGCNHQASSDVPSDGRYRITTFGGSSEPQGLSCGGSTTGYTYYAASRQRYGCGAKLRIEADGKCIVAEALDYGPDVCVEKAAGMPILDVAPAIARHLFGSRNSELGYSDKVNATITEVAASTPVGPCDPNSEPSSPMPPNDPAPEPQDPNSGGTSPGASCASDTLGRSLDSGACVQAASNAVWYQCLDGSWKRASDDRSECSQEFGFCSSATLDREVPARTCVQSASNNQWYQCNGTTWTAATSSTGPLGACAASYPL